MTPLKFIILTFCTIIFLSNLGFAQMPPSSLVAIPDTDAEFASKLNELCRKSGPSADFFRLKLAESKLKNGDTNSALKLANAVDNKSFTFWRDLIVAECNLTDNQPEKVLSVLAKLPHRPAPELSFGETFYANLYKRALLAIREAKILIGNNADHESAELAANFPLDSDVATYSNGLSIEQKITKLHILFFTYKYSLINNLVDPSEILHSNLPQEQKCKSLYELGYGLRRNDGMAMVAFEAFENLLSLKCERDLEAKALYWIGSLGPHAGKDQEADEALLKLAQNFKGHRLQDDGFYLLYKHAEKRDDVTQMQKYYQYLMKLPKGDMRDKLAFELAFPYYEKGDFERAVEFFASIVNSEAADENFTQVLYWYARSLQKMGGEKNSEKAKKVYEKIVTKYPFSFYAILAAARAGLALKVPPLSDFKLNAVSNDEGFFEIIDKLNKDGFHNAAKQVMDLAMNLNPSLEKSHKEFIAKKYIESQNYRKALDMAASHFDSGVYGPVELQNDPMFAAFYPTAFSNSISKGQKLTGLTRASITGIMREESLFQPNVRSHAGAVGLMQLMPRTAAMVARSGAGGANSHELTDPTNNVLLGSTYLKDMFDKFGGQMPLAIMAYNAGPGNVNKFLRNLKHMELDDFIENIPIDETRGYVKRVMRSQMVYGFLYNESESKKPISSLEVGR